MYSHFQSFWFFRKPQGSNCWQWPLLASDSKSFINKCSGKNSHAYSSRVCPLTHTHLSIPPRLVAECPICVLWHWNNPAPQQQILHKHQLSAKGAPGTLLPRRFPRVTPVTSQHKLEIQTTNLLISFEFATLRALSKSKKKISKVTYWSHEK